MTGETILFVDDEEHLRLAAEQALIQNEQLRLQGLAVTQAAEARLEEQRSRERAEAEFSWASIAEQTLGVYESVRR